MLSVHTLHHDTRDSFANYRTNCQNARDVRENDESQKYVSQDSRNLEGILKFSRSLGKIETLEILGVVENYKITRKKEIAIAKKR